jgi:hypothetical protein
MQHNYTALSHGQRVYQSPVFLLVLLIYFISVPRVSSIDNSREEAASGSSAKKEKTGATLSKSMLEAWSTLPAEVRAALVNCETSASSSATIRESSTSSMSTKSSVTSDDDTGLSEFEAEDPDTGAMLKMRPLERAPKNVFEFTKTHQRETTNVQKTAASMVTTKTTILTTSRGWRNVFSLPISYDVNMVAHGTLLDPTNPQLLESTGVHPEGYNRRFAVIDAKIFEIHGDKIRNYFVSHNIELHYVVLDGGEPAKRPDVSPRCSLESMLMLVCLMESTHIRVFQKHTGR